MLKGLCLCTVMYTLGPLGIYLFIYFVLSSLCMVCVHTWAHVDCFFAWIVVCLCTLHLLTKFYAHLSVLYGSYMCTHSFAHGLLLLMVFCKQLMHNTLCTL